MRANLGHLITGLLLATAAAAQPPTDLVNYGAQPVLPSPAATIARAVTVRTDLLNAGVRAFRLELPDGPVYVVRRTGLERRGPGDLAWRGKLEFDSGSRVVLTLRQDLVAGRIVAGADLYELRPLPGGGHAFEKLDPTLFPACADPVEPPPGAARGFASTDSAPEAAADPADEIRVMSLYTPQAKAAAGGQAQIETTIQAAVDNANTAFADSNMIARFLLVHTGESTRNDSGDMQADLGWLSGDPGVAALRDQQGADMVSLIVSTGAYCGIAYVMRNPGPAFESSAFQVTYRTCAVGNLSYAHEHGHNMGFEHDPANGTSPSNASYPWSFGHFVNGSYRTVMSYSNQCTSGCTRVAHFSNPAVMQSGQPTGIDNERDNARSGDLTAPIVANFRETATCGNGAIEGSEECDGADLGGTTCGDAGCSGGSVSCTATCTLDYSACTGCPTCDNDGACEAGEDCTSCPGDCFSGSGATCGNGVCEAGDGEDCVSCPQDCQGKTGGKPASRFCCGDGDGPGPLPCSDPVCTSGGYQCTDVPAVPSCCGDALCEGIEDGFNCELDCGPPPTCGDASCDPGEDSCSCAADCGAPPATEVSCTDGADNDCDGLVDCLDEVDCGGDAACTCEPVQASCTQDAECCSGKCRGPSGRKTCK